jgi:hypothetical protein
MAKAIVTLAGTGNGVRKEGAKMNVNKGLMKKSEDMSFEDISHSPVSILQGLSEEKGKILEAVGVHTVKELAELKYVHWAEAIVLLSEYEE